MTTTTATRWTESQDGKLRVTLRIDHRMELDDIAAVLAYCFPAREDVAGLSAANVVDAVRDTLFDSGAEGWDGPPAQDYHREAAARAFGTPVR